MCKSWTAVVGDPDCAGSVDGEALRVVEASAGVTVGDDRAGTGDLADAVACIVGCPDIAVLIDGEAVGAVAAGDGRF